MTMETKQLHALSKIYQEAVYGGAKKEAPKDTRMVVTAADKKANTKAYQNYKAGNKAYKAADHLKNESMQHRRNPEGTIKDRFKSKQTDPSKDNFTGIGDDIGEIMRQNAAMKKAAAKKTKKESYSDWRQDLKEIPNYEQIPASAKKRNEKISEKNVKNTVKINPEMKEEKRWQDDDGDGKWYEKSDVDGKISKREKKSKKHNCASKVKHEEFGVGDCISEAHDLDENGNVAHYDVEFEEYIVRGVPVGELEILEGTMHDHVIRDYDHVIREKHSADTKGKKNCGCGQDPCVTYGKQEDVKEGVYEKEKTKEVMGALKKRDLKKDVKKKIAADIVKRKGDTSKSDDRYAYESKLWDQVAANLTELGELNDATFKVEGYQRNPEKGEEEERKAKRERKGGYDERRERRMNDPKRGINSPAFQEFMRSRGM